MSNPVFKFNGLKGLTAQDRAQWEKLNIQELQGLGYYDWDDIDRDRYFKNVAFREKFKNRPDYDQLKQLRPEARDSFYENPTAFEQKKKKFIQNANRLGYSRTSTGELIGTTATQWRDFDKYLDQISPYYKKFKDTNYFPLSNDRKIELMATFYDESQNYGEEEAAKRMRNRIQDEVSNNQSPLDKLYYGFVGMGGGVAGGLVSFAGNVAGFTEAATGIDRLFGYNRGTNYFKNLWNYTIDNPLTQLGDQLMKRGTYYKVGDSYIPRIIRTVEEEEDLVSNIFSVNTVPELLSQSGFTLASMVEGYGLAAIGNKIFNTAKYATAASKVKATSQTASNLNKSLKAINTWQRRYNAYGVPALVGTGEGAMNALNTKMDYIQDATAMVNQEHGEAIEREVQKRLQGLTVPDYVTDTEGWLREQEAIIRVQVNKEFAPIYKNAMRRVEQDADKAALTNFALNSFINGAANVTLKAPMFGGKVTQALSRSKVGKLFSSNHYTTNAAGNVVAKKITKKGMAWNMFKEAGGEAVEEYSQNITDAFSRGAAEHDLSNYLAQRYNGVSEDAIVDSFADNLGAAFAAAGKEAVSKDALQSGIYGALGQFTGTPNATAWLSKDNRVSTKDKKGLAKFGAYANNIWRLPALESYYRDKQENQDREDAAKEINNWLSQGNNRERLTSLQGSLGWAHSMQKAADDGDEFSFRNSRLGKYINDYYMLEKLKDTPLYEAFTQRYMDVLNAEEGDGMAQQIAEYDDRPLQDIKKDAQNMLDIMGKIDKATEDIEKSFGNSIPQEVKESLVFGKLSIDDWNERGIQLENELLSASEDESMTGLTDEQKTYIARNGSMEAPDQILKQIEKIDPKIEALEKNKNILSSSQKKELKDLKKRKKQLENQDAKAQKKYEKLSQGVEENPVLSKADIMRLDPVSRYIMLNPKNRENYSQEQQEVIESLIEEGTAKTSDFMNKVEDAARIEDAKMSFLGQYNAALKNPSILSKIEAQLKLDKKLEDAKKSYAKINDITDYAAFAEAVDNALFEADPYEAVVLDQTLKDNQLYQQYKKNDEVAEGIFNQLLKNEAFKDMEEQDKDLVAAITKFLSRKGVDIGNYEDAISALTSTDNSGQSNLTKYIEQINQQLESVGRGNLKISLDNIGEVVTNYKKALQSFRKNEEVKQEIEKSPEEKEVKSDSPAPTAGIFDTIANSEENKKIQEEKQKEQPQQQNPQPIESKPSEDKGTQREQPIEEEKQDITELSDDFINNNSGEVLDSALRAINAIKNASSVYGEDAKQEAIKAINRLGSRHYDNAEELQEAIMKEANERSSRVSQGGDIEERVSSLLQQISLAVKSETQSAVEEKQSVTEDTKQSTDYAQQEEKKEILEQKINIVLARVNSNLTGFLSRKFKEWKVDDYIRSGKLSRAPGNMTKVYYISLEDVTNGVKQDMGDKYTDEQFLPVLAVVEDKEGPIVIGDKRYQPIGVLPNSQKDVRAEKIRQLAAQQPNEVLTHGNRKLVSTVIVHSPELSYSKSKEGDKGVLELIQKQINENPEDSKILNDQGQDPIRRNSIWTTYIEKIISRFFVADDKKGNPTLWYRLPNMKDGASSIPVLTKDFDEPTVSPNNGMQLTDALKSKNPKDLIFFNSRTRGFMRALSSLLESADLSDLTSDGTKFTGGSGLGRLETVDTILRRFIYSSISDYSIRPVQTGDKLGLALYLGDELLGTIIEDINNKEITPENGFNILSNLIAPSNFRKFAHWQVEKRFGGVYTKGSKDYDLEYLTNLINDDILRIGLNDLEREISSVEVTVPEAIKDPMPVNPTITTTNNDNATSQSSQSNEVASTQSGQQVDTTTGLTQDGQEPKNNITPIEYQLPEESTVEKAEIKPEVKPEPQVQNDGEIKVGKVNVKRRPIVRKDSAPPIKVVNNPMGISFQSLSEEEQEALQQRFPDIMDVEEYFDNLEEDIKERILKCIKE